MKTTDKPTLQNFHLEGVKYILPEDAMEAKNNNEAIIVDVREYYETSSYIEESQFHPMEQISSWMSAIPVNKPVIFLCSKGIRSAHVVHFLTKLGYSNAANLDGGFEAWKANGLPYKTGATH